MILLLTIVVVILDLVNGACSPGQYLDSITTTCVDCTGNTHSTIIDAPKCIQCDDGYISTANHDDCIWEFQEDKPATIAVLVYTAVIMFIALIATWRSWRDDGVNTETNFIYAFGNIKRK